MSTLFATHPAILHIFTVHRHLHGFVNGKYKVKVRVVNIKGKYDIPNLSIYPNFRMKMKYGLKGFDLNPPHTPATELF